MPNTLASEATHASPSPVNRVQLLRALRIVVEADSDPARQALFRNLTQSRRWVRLVLSVHRHLRGTWADTFVTTVYGLISFLTVAPPRERRPQVMSIAVHENARRQVDRVCSWIGASACGWIRTGWQAVAHPATLRAVARALAERRTAQVMRIVRVIEKRHGLLVASRAIRSIAWYARARMILSDGRPGAVLVSSDSNPEELAFLAAARVLDIPQVFISHAYPTPFSPALDFTLSILEGEAAVQARRRRGPIRGRVLLAGIEGDSAPIDPGRFSRVRPAIGIFTPKAVAWSSLATVIDDCRQHFGASEVIIRWHPSMLERARLRDFIANTSRIVEASSAECVGDVARRCDWVIADENSNVHLPVLKLGIPTIAVKNLGVYPQSRSDLYGFAANRVVFPAVTSLRELRADGLREFFSPGWSSRFARYDVSYLRSPDACARDVRRAIRAVIERSEPATIE